MNKNNKKYIIIIVLILIFIAAFIVIKKLNSTDKLEYEDYLRDYKVNEYISTYITDEEMAKIYLKDYVHTMYSNIEEAYELLDDEYKKAKFKNLEDFSNYINNLPYTKYDLSKYSRQVKNGYVIFYVYDNNGNTFIFKTDGVMQYSVYLDNNTVEIG